MKRAAVLVVLTATLVVLLKFASPWICCGWYDLTVEIDREFAPNVSRVSYMGANRGLSEAVIASVDEYLEFMDHQDSVEPIILPVGFSYREVLGQTWGDVQEYSDVIVVLHHDDGSKEVHRLEVPHRDDTRRILVGAATKTQPDISPV